MALKRDLSDLPPANAEGTGPALLPDPTPRFAPALVEKWDEARADRGKNGRSGERSAPFWLSDAGKCSRYLSLSAMQFPVPPGDEMDLAGVWNVELGSVIHEMWQEAIVERLEAQFPGVIVTVEARSLLEVEEGHRALFAIDPERERLASGYCDLLVVFPGEDGTPGEGLKVAVELKSIGGYGFKSAIGKIRQSTPPEGAKAEHILQAALNALAADTPEKPTDEAVVAYLAKECISVGQARDLKVVDRFLAEWTFPREQWEPLARAELARVAGIVALLDGGEVAARKAPELPAGAEVTDAMSGQWQAHAEDGTLTDVGKYWACVYCRHQATCHALGPGRQPVEAAIAIGKATDPEYVWPIPKAEPAEEVPADA